MKQVLECCLLSLSLFLFFSCGKEEEGSIPTDRQVPIGVMEASLSTRVSTRGVINTATYKLGIFRTDAQGYPPQYDAPYSYDGVAGWTATTEILRRRFWLPGFMMQLKICVTVPLRLQMDQA